MRRYRVVKGYKGCTLFEVERYTDLIKAKKCFEMIKKNTYGYGEGWTLITQIRCYYDDKDDINNDGYLEEEEIICSYEHRDYFY